jgi:hypothetical protein
MKYDFTKIILKDIEGKEVEKHDAHKILATGLYYNVTDLDLVEKARDINAGKEVEIDKVEIDKIKKFIESDKCSLVAFAKKATLDYINSVK